VAELRALSTWPPRGLGLNVNIDADPPVWRGECGVAFLYQPLTWFDGRLLQRPRRHGEVLTLTMVRRGARPTDGVLCGRWRQFLIDVPFLEVLTIVFIYGWRKGALEWN
jgi:hypothetical protein